MTARVVVVGLPGVGKTTTGRRLAKMFAVPFADSDDLVEAAAGRGVRDIFATSGEAAFRDLEQAAITAALRDFDGVLALGGGALGRAGTRAAIVASGVPVVLLRASVDTLLDRVGDAQTRPLLAADPRTQLSALAEQRGAVYAELATIVIDTDGKSPGQAAASAAARLHQLGTPA